MSEQEFSQAEGSVSAVIYCNEENGYTILRLDLGEEEITVVGSLHYELTGEYASLKLPDSPEEGAQPAASWEETAQIGRASCRERV